MKVELWSDFVCPNSYAGRQNFIAAVDQFPHCKYVVIEYKSYPLNNKMSFLKKEVLLTKDEHGITNQTNKIKIEHIDTINAHRLVHFAKTKQRDCQVVEKIFQAYFTEKKRIDDIQTLLSIAAEIQLCHEDIETIFMTNKYKRQVTIDQDEACQMGVTSLPFIVINEAYAISGMHSVNEYLQILANIWEEIKEQPRYIKHLTSSKTSYCTGDHCE